MLRRASGVLLLIGIVGLAACGGGKQTLDEGEPSESFEVRVTRASFPARQHLAANTDLVLTVTNASDKELPQLGVTIWTGAGGVGASKAQGSFSVPSGPVWLTVAGFPKLLKGAATLEDLAAAPSAGGDAAPTDTYALGTLAPRATRTIVWRTTPVRVGSYTVNYAIAAGLQGKAKAVATGGGAVQGTFRVRIDSSPRGGCVVKAGRPGDCA